LILLLLSSGIRTASGKEESITNPEWTDAEDDARGSLGEASDLQLANMAPSVGVGEGGYDVNIAGVRIISAKRRIREHEHAEFIVCTKRYGKEDVYVARRYGAFKRLHHDVFPRPGGSLRENCLIVGLVTRRISRKRYSSFTS